MTNGYNTLDALAGLAFAIVVISTLKDLGVRKSRDIAVSTFKAGIVVLVLMSVIYTALSWTGAMSTGLFAPSSNGGIALAQISRYYLGRAGAVLLAFIVTLACLKTAIGLITSTASAAVDLLPKIPYRGAIAVVSVMAAIFANAGLDLIIKASLPVLMFIYPLAIVLIILALIDRGLRRIGRGGNRPVYIWTTVLTGIAALLDALKIPTILPLASHGMGWVVPAAAGIAIGLGWKITAK
jgi:LIVCS family branched-chain amino acid:cation transporter